MDPELANYISAAIHRHGVETTACTTSIYRKTKRSPTLSREALWFSVHTAAPGIVLAIVVGGIAPALPDPDSIGPKLPGSDTGTTRPDDSWLPDRAKQQNDIAGYVGISGLLLFSVVCVYVLDLPTGNGLREQCGAIDRLWPTFFDITHGSGLISGGGLLIGTWILLSHDRLRDRSALRNRIDSKLQPQQPHAPREAPAAP